jgi:hypothetical protein
VKAGCPNPVPETPDDEEEIPDNNTPTPGSDENTAINGNGHAVYVSSGDGDKKRDATAGPGINLDSAQSGGAGGWE